MWACWKVRKSGVALWGVEEYLGKDKKLYAAFMDLEKAYNRVDREALWSVLRIYGVDGQLLKGIQAFYREANACVRVGGEFTSFQVKATLL